MESNSLLIALFQKLPSTTLIASSKVFGSSSTKKVNTSSLVKKLTLKSSIKR